VTASVRGQGEGRDEGRGRACAGWTLRLVWREGEIGGAQKNGLSLGR